MTVLRKLLLVVGLILAGAASPALASPVLTAAIHWTGGKAQFFLSDGSYIRYDIASDQADPGYPRPVDDRSWPGLGPYALEIAAACNGPNGKAYFFLSDGTYLRYDIAQDHVDAGYPKPIDDRNWSGLGPYRRQIWGALNWGRGKIQFFLNDGRYIRYDVAADRADPGYPKRIDRATWAGLAPYADELAGMINWDNGKVYFFLDTNQYLRYDVDADRVDPGYPKPIDERNWPGMGYLFHRKR